VALNYRETVRAHRHRIDAAFDQEFGEFRVIARRLTAKAHLGAGLVCGVDHSPDHPFDRRVLFIEQIGKFRRVAVDAEG
jgi:hypothetical protein